MKTAILVSALAVASCLLTSCGVSGTLSIPIPDELGGGSVPITITPQK